MKKMDYKQDNSDHTLFVKYVGHKVCILLVIVDDMMIRGDDEEEMVRLKRNFQKNLNSRILKNSYTSWM